MRNKHKVRNERIYDHVPVRRKSGIPRSKFNEQGNYVPRFAEERFTGIAQMLEISQEYGCVQTRISGARDERPKFDAYWEGFLAHGPVQFAT